jgi:hypothetical protein
MSEEKALMIDEIKVALSELNELAQSEYGIPLKQLITDRTPVASTRMQRLTGIVLKRKFATPISSPNYSTTGASRSWPWKDGSPEESGADAQAELKLLEQLRMPGTWNERKPLSGTSHDSCPITWDQFKDDVEHERGLFKVVALYVADKIQGREGRTLREYFAAGESRRFEAGLDLAVLLSDAAVVGPLAALLGLPTLAVGVALVGVQFGYRTLTDPAIGRLPDSAS